MQPLNMLRSILWVCALCSLFSCATTAMLLRGALYGPDIGRIIGPADRVAVTGVPRGGVVLEDAQRGYRFAEELFLIPSPTDHNAHYYSSAIFLPISHEPFISIRLKPFFQSTTLKVYCGCKLTSIKARNNKRGPVSSRIICKNKDTAPRTAHLKARLHLPSLLGNILISVGWGVVTDIITGAGWSYRPIDVRAICSERNSS